MAQKSALGKGLASLFPNSQNETAAPNPTPPQQADETDPKPQETRRAETKTSAGKAESGADLPAGALAAGNPQPVISRTSQSQAGTAASASAGLVDAAQSPPMESKDRHHGISMAAVGDIENNNRQPRRDFDDHLLEELAQSIRTSGIIQPLVVRKTPKGSLELIAGERRLRAAKIAGLTHVPIVIRRSTTDRESLELALIENIQRQNLNCVDEALAYFQLIQDFSLTQEDVADRVGKDRATISNYLRLLRLPPTIIEDLKRQTLSFGHGKALLGLDDAEHRMRARNQVIDKRLSVRETEKLVDSIKNTIRVSGRSGADAAYEDPVAKRLMNLSQELTRFWSAKVELKGSERRGKVLIHYNNRQELDRIIRGLQEGIRSK